MTFKTFIAFIILWLIKSSAQEISQMYLRKDRARETETEAYDQRTIPLCPSHTGDSFPEESDCCGYDSAPGARSWFAHGISF